MLEIVFAIFSCDIKIVFFFCLSVCKLESHAVVKMSRCRKFMDFPQSACTNHFISPFAKHKQKFLCFLNFSIWLREALKLEMQHWSETTVRILLRLIRCWNVVQKAECILSRRISHQSAQLTFQTIFSSLSSIRKMKSTREQISCS